MCYRRFKFYHFGRLCRYAIDHRRHSIGTGQCVIGTGGQFGIGEKKMDFISYPCLAAQHPQPHQLH